MIRQALGSNKVDVQLGTYLCCRGKLATCCSRLAQEPCAPIRHAAAAWVLQDALGSDKVEVQLGAYLEGRGNDNLLDQAVQSCQEASVCILLLGLTALNPTAVTQVSAEPFDPASTNLRLQSTAG